MLILYGFLYVFYRRWLGLVAVAVAVAGVRGSWLVARGSWLVARGSWLACRGFWPVAAMPHQADMRKYRIPCGSSAAFLASGA